jgi:hypothetical protein
MYDKTLLTKDENKKKKPAERPQIKSFSTECALFSIKSAPGRTKKALIVRHKKTVKQAPDTKYFINFSKNGL